MKLFSMGSVDTHNNPDMKNKMKQNLTKNESNLPVLNYHFIKDANILTLEKLTEISKKIKYIHS